MKKILGGVAACSLVFAPITFASHFKAEEGYVGVEAIQTNQDYKAGFGKKIFKKNTMDYSVFGGFKFHKHFGVEAGFEFQPNKSKNASLLASDPFPNQLPSGATATTASSFKSTNPYLGLFAERIVGSEKIKFQGLVGLSATHVKAKHQNLSGNGFVYSPAVSAATIKTYAKTKIVPMVKVSATYMATQHVGIRLSGNYRNMSAFKIKAKENPDFIVKLKDSFGVGLGLTYSFN